MLYLVFRQVISVATERNGAELQASRLPRIQHHMSLEKFYIGGVLKRVYDWRLRSGRV